MRGAILVLLGRACALQHSAMWGLNSASDADGWATLTFDVSDPGVILANHKSGLHALFPVQWTAPQAKPCYVPVPHQRKGPTPYFNCITIAPDYRERWTKQWQTIKPLADAGAAIGVFLGDEHLYFGLELSNVKAIADLIRLDWPEAIIYMNEAPDIAMCNFRKDNTTVFGQDECLPSNVDWFGFDFYARDSTSWRGPEEAYQTFIYPRLPRVDQRVVPTSLGYAEGNLSAAAAASLDSFCATNALRIFEWGLRDRRVVGAFPFHYNGGTRHPDGSITGGAGIFDLPRCLATYKGLGQVIVAAGPRGTSQDLALAPPTPTGGVFPEPKCKTPMPQPPSTWAWCSRH